MYQIKTLTFFILIFAFSCTNKKEDPEVVVAPSLCDTENITYSGFVEPLLFTHCVNCHNDVTTSGNVDLSTHAKVKVSADNGDLYGAISHQENYTPMPFSQDKLPECDIAKIKAWIDQGAPNN